MFNLWFYLMLLATLADWYAVTGDRYRVRYVTKPLTLALLIGWFTSCAGWQAQAGIFFGLGLVFSLLGDVFLLKGLLNARPGFFQIGLLAFLVTQVMYIFGFSRTGALFSFPVVGMALPVLAVGYVNANRIVRCLSCHAEGRRQIIPVMVYMIALSLMLISALSTLVNPGWLPAPALLAAVGAGLFYISDSVLAHDAFVEPIRTGQTLLIVTYHLGQIALIGGFLMRAGS